MAFFKKWKQSAEKSKLIKKAASYAQAGQVPEAVDEITAI